MLNSRFGILELLIELQNRVMQNDITLRLNNWEIFTEILFSSY